MLDPPDHPKLDHFRIDTHGDLGIPHCRKPAELRPQLYSKRPQRRAKADNAPGVLFRMSPGVKRSETCNEMWKIPSAMGLLVECPLHGKKDIFTNSQFVKEP